MAVQSVKKAFVAFEAKAVRVPDTDNKAAKKTHPQIRDALEVELAELLERTFLSGSYSRRVQVVRLNDVDVIVVLSDLNGTFAVSADAALETVRGAIAGHDLVERTQKRVRSIRLTLKDYEWTIDLVVALRPVSGGGMLLARRLPEEGFDDWTLGHPKGQRDAAHAKNDACDGDYIPLVRIVKFWNESVGKPLRSYHAEAILYHALPGPVDYAQGVVRFFDAAYDALAPSTLTPDPGAPMTYVDERLSDEDRVAAREKIQKARADAHAAFGTDDVGGALDAWVKVFGPSFPAPSTAPDKVARALGTGTAGAFGAGIRSDKGRPIIQPRSWRRS